MPKGDRGQDVNDNFIYRKTNRQGLLITLAEKEILQLSVKLYWDIKGIKEAVDVAGIRLKVI